MAGVPRTVSVPSQTPPSGGPTAGGAGAGAGAWALPAPSPSPASSSSSAAGAATSATSTPRTVALRHGYASTLHALCHEGPKRRGNWDRVVGYLERHSSEPPPLSPAAAVVVGVGTSFGGKACRGDGGGGNPPPVVAEFSTLDPALVPSDRLRDMGARAEGTRGDETSLAVAVARGAPAHVVAALCQLFPQSAAAKDSEGRLPIHRAAERPTGGLIQGGRSTPGGGGGGGGVSPASCSPGQDAHNVLRVLAACHPPGLVARDDRGRTPLHVLFARHPESRGVGTIEVLCGDVDPDVIREEARRHREEVTRRAEADELDGGVPGAAGPGRNNARGLGTVGTELTEDDAAGGGEEGIEIENLSVAGRRVMTPRVSHLRRVRRLPRLPPIPIPTLAATPTRGDPDGAGGQAVPPNAAVIPDSIHGCLPLHYAVMNGATPQAVRCLLGKYPASIRTGDRYGRTALGWYLGGSEWEAEEREQEVEREAAAAAQQQGPLSPPRLSASASALEGDGATVFPEEGSVADLRRAAGLERVRLMRSVTGEAPASAAAADPASLASAPSGASCPSPSSAAARRRAREGEVALANAMLHRNHRSAAMISLLLNQSVASAADGRRRLPLHFAARLLVMSLLDPPEDEAAAGDPVLATRRPAGPRPDAGGCIALKAIKLLVDSNRSALAAPDIYGRTPLHVLFVTAHAWNKREYHSLVKNERLNGRYVDGPGRGGQPGGARPFRPPSALVRLFLRRAVGPDTTTPATPTAGRARAGGREGYKSAPQDKDRGGGRGGARSPIKSPRPGYLDDDDYFDDALSAASGSSDVGSDYESDYLKESGPDDDDHSSGDGSDAAAAALPLSEDGSTSATYVEDRWGLLPLHYAVVTVAPPKVVRALIQSHPMSVLHTTHGTEDSANGEDADDDLASRVGAAAAAVALTIRSPGRALGGLSRTPLHLAFSSPYTARLQTVKTLAPLLEKPSASAPQRDHTAPKKRGTLTGFRACPNSPNDSPEVMAVDGSLALKMEDGTGRFPLHLAAEHGASTEVLRTLLSGYEPAALAQNRNGDLPLHLLMDANLFMNVEVMELAADLEIMGNPDRAPNLLDKQARRSCHEEDVRRRRARQTKVRAMAAQAARLSRTGVGGAVFGQIHGWMSDDDEKHHLKTRKEAMLRCHLLLEPLVNHRPSLLAADSRHRMTPLHIAVAFHAAGYGSIRAMLLACLGSARARTVPVGEGGSCGYTPLDLHLLRRRFPNEVPPDEMGSWHAIRELLFSYELYPLGSAGEAGTGMAVYRRDRDLLMRCVRIVRADARPGKWSTHSGPCAPFDPLHVEIGLVKSDDLNGPMDKDDAHSEGLPVYRNGTFHTDGFHLGDVASRLWTFLATFTNKSDPDDHYAPYVEAVIVDLEYPSVQGLIALPLPDCCASERTGTIRNLSGITVRDCANDNCRAVIHATFYFAGLYDFTPPLPPALGVDDSCAEVGAGNGGGSGSGAVSRGPSILLHRGAGGRTLLLRATEHRFTTAGDADAEEEEEKADGGASGAGGVEVSAVNAEEVGAGAAVVDTSVHKRLVSNFRVTARPVCIKFLQNPRSYEREVRLRSRLGAVLGRDDDIGSYEGLVVPILNHYNATGTDRPADQRYQCDLQDPRFRLLPLYQSSSPETVDISQYPYAIVLPLLAESDLGDKFRHEGMDNVDSIKDVAMQVGRGLKFLHANDIIHGNINMGNIISAPFGKYRYLRWMLTDLTSSSETCVRDEESSLPSDLGEISPTGVTCFSSGSLPPEMFLKLTPKELSMYGKYWSGVMKVDGVTVDPDLVLPWIDPISGDVFVVKCHCNLKGNKSDELDLPPLPYELIPPKKAIDLWSFGVLLFTLCSGGQSLFPTNYRSGNLSSLEGITKWNKDVAKQVICDQIKDPIAQDILLHLLSPEKERSSLKVEAVLSHPFFTKEGDVSAKTRKVLQKITEQRQMENQARKEQLKQDTKCDAGDHWAGERTVTITHPSLDLRMRMLHSTTELTKVVFNASDQAPSMPFCFILLPYKLTRNKSGKLTPSNKKEVELCERVGRLVLILSKASVFVHALEVGLKKDIEKARQLLLLWADGSESHPEKVIKKILSFVGLDAFKFFDLSSAYVSSIRAGREFFLSDPLYMARKLMHSVIKDLLNVFADAGRAYLYMVDEFCGTPVVPPAEDGTSCYPRLITHNISKVFLKAFPFMQMCILHARGAAGGISGLVKLIFEGAYPHIPPSWSVATKGLAHCLDRESMVGEIKILRVALEEMMTGTPCGRTITECGDSELRSIEAYFHDFDSGRTFANLYHVTDGEASFWATKPSIEDIEKDSDSAKVLEAYYAREAQKEALREKDAKIAELERALQAVSLNGIDEKKIQG